MKKNMIKAAMLASVIVCTILTSCNKEEDEGLPTVKSTHRKTTPSSGVLSEDRPKRAKGSIRTNAMLAIPGAEIYLGRSLDSLVLDTFVSDTSGNFESHIEIIPTNYYVIVKATGYQSECISFTVPTGPDFYHDLGVIVLENANPAITE